MQRDQLTNTWMCIWCKLIVQWCLLVVSWNYARGVDLGEVVGVMTKQYEMRHICGQTVNMATENIFVADVNFNAYWSPPNCTLIIKPGLWTKQNWNSLSIQFRDYRIEDESCVTLSTLNDTGSPTDIIRRFCRDSYGYLQELYDVTNGESLMIEYEENKGNFGLSTKFDIAVALYRYGPCDTHQCDNKRCIPDALKCRGYGVCGDGSDCPVREEPARKGLGKGSIVGIVISVVAGVLIVLYCCYIRIKKSEEDDGSSSYRADELSDHRYSVPSSNDDIEVNSSRDRDSSIDVNSSLYRDYWENDSDDDSIDLQPFYTREGQMCLTMSQNHHDIQTTPTEQEPAVLSTPTEQEPAVPSTPSLSNDIMPSSPSMSHNTIHTTDAIIEPTTADNDEVNTPLTDAPVNGDVFINNSEAPPPSYDEVMTHEEFYQASSEPK